MQGLLDAFDEENAGATLALVYGWARSLPEKQEESGDRGSMDTLGALVDKLVTVNMKMWHNQEVLYEIRRMTPEEYTARWENDLLGLRDVIKRCCDLNVQRSRLMDEIDKFLRDALEGKHDGGLVHEQHKTY